MITLHFYLLVPLDTPSFSETTKATAWIIQKISANGKGSADHQGQHFGTFWVAAEGEAGRDLFC